MGWNVRLRAWFKDKQPPKERFIALTKHIEQSFLFNGLGRLCIFAHGSHGGEIAKFDSPYAEVFSIEQIKSILQQYNDESIGIEGWWGVSSHYFDESHLYVDEQWQYDSSRKIVEGVWRLIITIPGKDYYFPGFPQNIGMVCEIGPERDFSPRIAKERAHLNILSLLHELSVLAEFNLATMYGLDIDDNPDPRTFYLCYHSDPNGFRNDLSLWTQHLTHQVNFTKQDIVGIIQYCQDIEYLEVGGGVFVFHQDLVDGNLGDFYTEILRLLGTS